MHGSVAAEQGIGRRKQQALLQHESPVAIDVMAAIETVIDPRNLFNPGRVLPRERLASR